MAKPLFGAQGVGLQRLSAGMDVPAPEECANVWYLQRYVDIQKLRFGTRLRFEARIAPELVLEGVGDRRRGLRAAAVGHERLRPIRRT